MPLQRVVVSRTLYYQSSLSHNEALHSCLGTCKAPWLDLSFEKLVQLSCRATGHRNKHGTLYEQTTSPNLPLSFRNQEPNSNDKRQPDACIEPSGFVTPIPVRRVRHLRNQDVHDYADDARASGTETGSVWAEAL